MFITTLALAATLTTATPAPAAIQWHRGSFASALARADETKTPALIYFWANGSGQCVRLYSETMSQDSTAAALADFVCISADTGTTDGRELVDRYGVRTLPTLLFVASDGHVEDAILGFIDPGGLVEELARVRRGEKTVTDFKRKAEAAPSDLEIQYAYAVKLQDCGDGEGYDKIVASIRATDPDGKTPLVGRLLLAEVEEQVLTTARSDDGEVALDRIDLAPVVAFVKHAPLAETQFEGWSWIASVERKRENAPAMRQAYAAGWQVVPEEKVMDYGGEIVEVFWEQRSELDKAEKKLALEAAGRAVEAAAAYVEKAREEALASDATGCMSYAGCAEGDDEGCGGCPGQKGELACLEGCMYGSLARSYFVNGKRSKAITNVNKGLDLEPDNEQLQADLAMYKDRKAKL